MSIMEERKKVIAIIEEWKERLTVIDSVILESVKDSIPHMGSKTVEYEGSKIIITVPKKVTWDQPTLKQIAVKIQLSGDDPEKYIDYKLNVTETSYKTWSHEMQIVFMPARTVSTGKPSLKVLG